MLGLGSSLVYDGGTLADELLDSYPGAAAAYSLRSLNSNYSGAAVSVRPEEGVIGMILAGGEEGYNGGMKRVPPQNYATTETGRFSCEVYYDAQGLPDGEFHRWTVRYGYTTSLNQGVAGNVFLYNRQWTKIEIDTASVDSQQIELYPSSSTYIPIAGDQIFLRNIQCEAPSFSVDYDTANWQILSGGANGTIVNSFDVGFDSNGGLDQEAVTTFGLSAADALLLSVTDNYGDADSLVGIDKTYNEVTNAGTGTLTFDVYADCPSIAGSVAIHAGVGTIQTAVVGSPITQGQWTSVTRTSSTTADHGRIAIYVGGDGTSTLNQQLAAGDKIYIRNLRFVHDNGAGDDLDSFPDFTSGLGGFAEYNDTSAVELSYGASSGSDLTAQTWYDQSGNSSDATQTTVAKQPKIYDGLDGLITQGDKYAIEFSSGDYYATSSAHDTGTSNSHFYVAQSTGTNQRVIDTRGTGTNVVGWHHKFSNGASQDVSIVDDGVTNFRTENLVRSGHYLVSVLLSQSSLFEYTNGSLAASDTSTTVGSYDSNNPLYIGANADGANTQLFVGKMQEIVLYNSDQSSAQANIEKNINDYYSIYS